VSDLQVAGQAGPIDTKMSKSVHGHWNRFPMRLFCLPRHEGAVNLVFLDGSVGAVPLRALWKLKWHKSFDINGYWTTSSAPWPKWMLRFRDEY